MTLMRGIMTLAIIVGNLMVTSTLALGATPAPGGAGVGAEKQTIQQAAAEHLDAVEAGNAMKYGGFRTKEYFDAVQAGKEPDIRPLLSKYGTKEFIREMARQARTRNSETLTLYVLDHAKSVLMVEGPLADMAREALDSPSEALRLAAARGYTRWWPSVPKDLRKKAGDIIRRRFAESKGEECRGEMFTIRAREDAPMVREIYEAHYRRFLPPVIDTPLEDDRPVQPLSQEVKDALRAMWMLRLLAELGDRDAAEELKERDPQKVKLLRSEERWRKRRAEVNDRMSRPVSLQADVAAYLDFRLRGDGVTLEPLYDLYGQEVWLKEAIRQAEDRKSEDLLNHLLAAGSIPKYDCLRALAVKNLESDSDYMRRNAVEWCERNADALSPAERNRYAQAVRQWFFASDGREGYTQMKQGLATPADLPAIRSLYDRRYKIPKPGDPHLYSLWSETSRLLLLLVQLGDAAALQEIRAAIEQEKDPQQRLWGILMAAKLKDTSLLTSYPVSPEALEADVAAYLDDIPLHGVVAGATSFEARKALADLYGQEAWFKEAIRQAEERKSQNLHNHLYLVNHLLVAGSDLKCDCLRALAVKNLEADSDSVRGRAVQWCERNADALSPAERDRYAQAVRQWFFASDGRQGYTQMKQGLATPADLPAIRRLYDRRYKTPKPGAPPLYSCANANINLTRSDILLLLAQLGEAAPLREIRAAIEQEEDPQQRLWGILLAARLEDRSLVPLIAKALDDKRPSKEPTEGTPDPEEKSRWAWLAMYTRVCDLAVRAIHELDPPAERWPFSVPLARVWRVNSAYESFDFKQDLGKGFEEVPCVHYSTIMVLSRRVIVGFTDDQIEYARRYAALEIQ
ncbi:MAG: hypothetical protein WBD75_09230 [Phycisphaerae bacterium]